MTGTGVSFTSHPALNTPHRSWRPPTDIVIRGKAANPWWLTACATRTEIAAAGPVTASVVPPKTAATGAAMPAVTRASCGGTPLATAMAMFSGTATQMTDAMDTRSRGRVLGSTAASHSLPSDGTPRCHRTVHSDSLNWDDNPLHHCTRSARRPAIGTHPLVPPISREGPEVNRVCAKWSPNVFKREELGSKICALFFQCVANGIPNCPRPFHMTRLWNV
mmetsp:Transcript_9969/g.27881  ORF Transcript_9969/g.27881 Transcript_9969/m.27881 type:complete len:220 (+) Transcript_9969:1678-2337(+)